MTIDSLLAMVGSAIGAVLAMWALAARFNKPHQEEHKNFKVTVDALNSALTEIKNALVDIKIELAKDYITGNKLSEELKSVRREHERDKAEFIEDIKDIKNRLLMLEKNVINSTRG